MRSRSLFSVFAAVALIGATTSCDDDSITGIDENFRESATWVANLAPVTGTNSTGTGRIWFVDRGNTIDYYMEYSGLLGNATNAHIHRRSTGDPIIQLLFVRQTSGVAVGTIDMTRTGTGGASDVAELEAGTQSAADIRTLLSSGNGAYVNVHSTAAGAGEIQGDIGPS